MSTHRVKWTWPSGHVIHSGRMSQPAAMAVYQSELETTLKEYPGTLCEVVPAEPISQLIAEEMA